MYRSKFEYTREFVPAFGTYWFVSHLTPQVLFSCKEMCFRPKNLFNIYTVFLSPTGGFSVFVWIKGMMAIRWWSGIQFSAFVPDYVFALRRWYVI
jgi:hypothetical protein